MYAMMLFLCAPALVIVVVALGVLIAKMMMSREW